MDTAGSTYTCSGRNIVNIFSQYDDVHMALPPPMKGGYLAHAKYTFGNVTKAIDVYDVEKVLADNFNPLRNMDIRNVHFSPDHSRDRELRDKVLRDHNVAFEFQKDLKGTTLEDQIITIVAKCVHAYRKSPAKSQLILPSKYSDEIIPVTKIGYVDTDEKKPLLESGKGDFILGCDIDANIDFSKGCIAGWVKGKYSSFEPYWDAITETFYGFVSDKYQECNYCYKIYGHDLFSKTMRDIVGRKDELVYLLSTGDFPDYFGKTLGRKVRLLRGGKTTEVGSIYTLPHLITTMEACLETKTPFVFPTKYLEFNKELLEYMKNPLINALFSVSSVGFLEKGPNKDGKNVKWRLEQARRFKEHGANVGLFLMMDYVYGKKAMDEEIIAYAKKYNIPVIPLQQTIMNKDLAMPMAGRTWEELIQPWGQKSIDGKIIGGYKLKGDFRSKKSGHALIPAVFNPELATLLGDNSDPMFSGCAHTEGAEGKTYCAGCGHRTGTIIKTEKPSSPLDLDSYKGLNTNDAADKYAEDIANKVKKNSRRKKIPKQPLKLFGKEELNSTKDD